MPTFTTVEEAVEFGANAFANAEDAARIIITDFRDLKDVFTYLRDESLIGGIEAAALSAECDSLPTLFLAELYALHSRLTERAKDLGIDLPSIASGGR